MTWDESSHARFQELRGLERDGKLGEADQAELARLLNELEQQEAEALAPGTARIRDERLHLESRSQELEALVERRQMLVERLRSVIQDAEIEQRSIEDEKARILAGAAP